MFTNCYADLHLHTNHSDGSDSPGEVVAQAANAGLSVIAITDHDTLSGLAEARAAGAVHGVETLSGIEISTSLGEKSVHIVAYLFDESNDAIQRLVANNGTGRSERLIRMVEKLNALGYAVDYDDLTAFIGKGTPGRALLADYLVKKEFFADKETVFGRLLGDGKPVYEPVPRYTPAEAIEMVAAAGGVTSLAHPGLTKVDDAIEEMVEAGLDALEVYSPQHHPGVVKRYLALVKQYDLLITGGSDSHGSGFAGRAIGSLKLPGEHVVALKERAAERQTALFGR